jgi:PAS domain S-box-containing protein
LYDGRGHLVRWYGTTTDIHDRKWAEALLAGENRLLEMIARGDSLTPILDAVCRLVEGMCKGCLCSILLLAPEGDRLRHGAAPSLPASYTQAIDGSAIGPSAGSCGTAAYRREPVVVADIATDPLWANYRHLALPHGLRACWSTPIFSSEGNVLGTFAIYAGEPCGPTAQHLTIIEQMTHLAAVAIERSRTEAVLKESEERLRRMADRFEGILDIADEAIISVDSHQRILLFNQGAEKVFGYSQAEVVGCPVDLLLPQRLATVHQKHFEEFARSPDVARRMGQRREVSGRRKDGGEFPADASISKLDLGGELVFTVILRDITDRKRAEQRLVAQHTVTQVLAEAATLEEATPRILQAVCECLAWDLGELWRIDRAAGVLRCVEVWHKASIAVPEFTAMSHERTFLPGMGLPGRVWASREPAHIPDVAHPSQPGKGCTPPSLFQSYSATSSSGSWTTSAGRSDSPTRTCSTRWRPSAARSASSSSASGQRRSCGEAKPTWRKRRD